MLMHDDTRQTKEIILKVLLQSNEMEQSRKELNVEGADI